MSLLSRNTHYKHNKNAGEKVATEVRKSFEGRCYAIESKPCSSYKQMVKW